MYDLISRQEAIEELNGLPKYTLLDREDCVRGVGIRLKFAEQTLRKLPYVQPKQQWIPCSERLPETEDMMLVSCETKKGIKTVNRAYYCNGFWHGSGSMSGVIAWMPLPEPYEEG